MNYSIIGLTHDFAGKKYSKEYEGCYANSHWAGIPELGRKNFLAYMKIDYDTYDLFYFNDGVTPAEYLAEILKSLSEKVQGRKQRTVYGQCTYFRHVIRQKRDRKWFELMFYTNKEDVDKFLVYEKELGRIYGLDEAAIIAQNKEIQKAKEALQEGKSTVDEMKEIFAAPEKRKRGRPKKSDQEKAAKLEAKTAKEKTKKKFNLSGGNNTSSNNANAPKKRGRPKKMR